MTLKMFSSALVVLFSMLAQAPSSTDCATPELTPAEGWSFSVLPHKPHAEATSIRIVFVEEALENRLRETEWIVPTTNSTQFDYRLVVLTSDGQVIRRPWRTRDTRSRFWFLPRDVEVAQLAVESPTSRTAVSQLAYKQALRAGILPPLLFTPDGQQMSFVLEALSGELILSQELLGKTVIIDGWASWCGPCQPVSKKLMELSSEHENLAVVFLIFDDGSTQDAVAKKLEELPPDWIVVQVPYEPTGSRELWELALNGGVRIGLPHLVLLDRNGIVQPTISHGTQGELKRRIEELVDDEES